MTNSVYKRTFILTGNNVFRGVIILMCCCQYIDVYEMADVVQSTEIGQHHSTKCT